MKLGNLETRTGKAVALASGQALASVSGLFITVVVSRSFSLREYGTYRQVMLCFTMVTSLLAMGLPMALYYYLPQQKERSLGVIFENAILLVCMGLLFTTFLWLGGAMLIGAEFRNQQVTTSLLLMSPYAVLLLVRQGFGPSLMSENRVNLLAVYNAVSRLGEGMVIIAAVVMWRSLTSVWLGMMLGSIIGVAAGAVLVLKTYNYSEFNPTLQSGCTQMKFGVTLGLAQMIAMGIDYMDQFLVSSCTSPESYAVYVNGALKLPLIGVIVSSVTTVLLPELVTLYNRGQKAEMLRVWQSAMVKTSLIALPLAIFLAVLASDAIALLFSEKYLGSVAIFRIFLIGLPFQMISYGPMFIAANRNRWIVGINCVVLPIQATMMFFMIKYYGIYGAAVGTVFTQVCVRIFLHIWLIGRITEVPALTVFPWRRLASVLLPLLVLAVPLTSRYGLSSGQHWWIFFYAMYFFPAWYLWGTKRCLVPRLMLIDDAFGWIIGFLRCCGPTGRMR